MLTMQIFWWLPLSLLLLLQLLEQNNSSHNFFAAGLLARRSSVGNVHQYDAPGSGYPSHDQQTGRRQAAIVEGGNGVPTLTPLQDAESGNNNPKKQRDAAILISGVCAAVLVVSIALVVYLCLMRLKRFARRSSESVSSASPTVEIERGGTRYGEARYRYNAQDSKELTIRELELATNGFSPKNVIGEGALGIAYKGLLFDGSIVAIKRHLHNPVCKFRDKMFQIGRIQHQNIVKLIGYCEDRHQQLLVYEYISNGNVGNLLYDSEGLPTGKLDVRQRLLIAKGAAAGLEHLHSMSPPVLHMNFKTSNVLVCENLRAKVSDYALPKLLMKDLDAASTSIFDCFLDPELHLSKNFSEQSDVYSFGVFLLVMISGRPARANDSDNNLVLEARSGTIHSFADKTIGQRSMQALRQLMELAILCLDAAGNRPTMTKIVHDIEKIHASELGYSEIGEDIGDVKLGSELFK